MFPGGTQPCSLVEANQLQPIGQDAIGTSAAGLADALATAKQVTWMGAVRVTTDAMASGKAGPGLGH